MSVRVVARIRPLLSDELERDVIVHAASKADSKKATIVKIPNPKNEAEEFSFAFNGVYDQDTTQEELFTAEGATPPDGTWPLSAASLTLAYSLSAFESPLPGS